MRSQRWVSVEWMSIMGGSTLFLLCVWGQGRAEFGLHEPEAADGTPAAGWVKRRFGLERFSPVAQDVLLDFAGGRFRQQSEDHRARDFEARQMLAAETDDVG